MFIAKGNGLRENEQWRGWSSAGIVIKWNSHGKLNINISLISERGGGGQVGPRIPSTAHGQNQAFLQKGSISN